MKSFVKQGDTLTVTSPTGGTASGALVLIGAALLGVPVTDSVAGDRVEIKRTGLFSDQAKAAGAAWVAGDVLYFDPAAKNLTKTSASNVKAGVAVEAAASGDTTGAVLLIPSI